MRGFADSVPRVAVIVTMNICAATVEVIGSSDCRDVTMDGESTIYFMIGEGLTVDYSVHIAHTFDQG